MMDIYENVDGLRLIGRVHLGQERILRESTSGEVSDGLMQRIANEGGLMSVDSYRLAYNKAGRPDGLWIYGFIKECFID